MQWIQGKITIVHWWWLTLLRRIEHCMVVCWEAFSRFWITITWVRAITNLQTILAITAMETTCTIKKMCLKTYMYLLKLFNTFRKLPSLMKMFLQHELSTVNCHCQLSLSTVNCHCQLSTVIVNCQLSLSTVIVNCQLSTVIVNCQLSLSTVNCHCQLSTVIVNCQLSLSTVIVNFTLCAVTWWQQWKHCH